MPQILPYTNFFPTMVRDIFSRCVHHTCLHHSILSISSLVADSHLHRPLDRFYHHYIITLQSIQTAIRDMKIDEGVVITVFLLLWIDMIRAELNYARKHMVGLYLILQEMQRGDSIRNAGFDMLATNRSKLSPLLIQIWRLAVKIDWTTSLHLIEEPILPPISAEEDFHDRRIEVSVSVDSSLEWARAAFELDNLIHRACRVASQVRSTRRALKSTPEVEHTSSSVTKLENDIQAWRNRPVIQAAELSEQAAQGNWLDSSFGPFSANQSFLHYSPLRIVNSFYANLLNGWRALSIYLSLINNPSIDPAYPQRFEYAVDICRTLAALGRDPSTTASSKIWVIFLAGVAFGGSSRSPREVAWLSKKVDGIVSMFPLMRNASLAYQGLWDTEQNFWNELEKSRDILY